MPAATPIDARDAATLYSRLNQISRAEATMKPMLFGKYCLLERVSIGGMAEVFRAKPLNAPEFQGYLALKRILPHLAEDQEFIMMFVDEAKLTVKFQHPNIVRTYELGTFQSSYYILMEYIAGRDVLTLQKRVRKQKKTIGVGLSCYIAREIALGLHHAHLAKGEDGQPLNIIHRDVSPQNVLVDYLGNVKVIDFGIAKAAVQSTKTQIGVLKGKMGYMSPEQVQGIPLDPRSDVFAIGTVLWEMLTNRRLFNGANEYETMTLVKSATAALPSTKNPEVTPEVDQIVMKALTEDPDDRYSSALDFANALTAWIEKHPVGAEEMSLWMREAFAEELAGELEKRDGFSAIVTPDDVRAISELPLKDSAPDSTPEKTELWAGEAPQAGEDAIEFAAQHTVIQAGGFDLSLIQTEERDKLGQVSVPPPIPVLGGLGDPTVERASLSSNSDFSRVGTRPGTRQKASKGVGPLKILMSIVGVLLFMLVCVGATFFVATEVLKEPKGGLLFSVGPAESQILVDGTPVSAGIPKVDGLSVGAHLIEVRADGFKSYQEEVTVKADTIQPVDIELEPDIVEVTLPVSVPKVPGTRIYLNGELRVPAEAEAGLVLGEGTHLLEVTAPQMRPWKKFIDVEEGRDVSPAQVTLSPATYSLEVLAEENSVVRFNKARLGTVPVTVKDISPYEIHKVEVSLRSGGVSRWSGYFGLPEIAGKTLRLAYDTPRSKHKKSNFGYLTISSAEAWFSVWIDGYDTGLITPIAHDKKLPLSTGEHELSLRRGFDKHDYPIDIRRGETLIVRKSIPFEWEPTE